MITKSSTFFKTLGNETRMKIINSILEKKENVKAISEETGMTQSAVSHQLKLLKTNNIVKSERNGKEIFYSLSDKHVKDIILIVYEHMKH